MIIITLDGFSNFESSQAVKSIREKKKKTKKQTNKQEVKGM